MRGSPGSRCRVTWSPVIHAMDGETDHAIAPDEVVLATGRFIGGGVACGERAVETLLGLPVVSPGADVQGTMESGVDTDGDLRPLGKSGEVVFANVRVAGNVRAGGSYTCGTGGIGLAVLQGMRAGEAASNGGGRRAPGASSARSRRFRRRGRRAASGARRARASARCSASPRGTARGTRDRGPCRDWPGRARSSKRPDIPCRCARCARPARRSARSAPATTRRSPPCGPGSSRSIPRHAPAPYLELPRVLARSGNVFGAEIERLEGPRRPDAEVAFFPGCTLPYFEPESAAHTVRLLASLGVPLSIVDGVCCGGPLDVLGLEPRKGERRAQPRGGPGDRRPRRDGGLPEVRAPPREGSRSAGRQGGAHDRNPRAAPARIPRAGQSARTGSKAGPSRTTIPASWAGTAGSTRTPAACSRSRE